jgi:ATP-dependent Clp endopeptidase proteolytic subunit ClpP
MVIKISGIIGLDTTAKGVYEQLEKSRGDVEIQINSPGGSVFEGLELYNAIRNYKNGKIHCLVVSLAASMASYIMLAGDTLQLTDNSVVMIHNPLNFVYGDFRTMKKEADILERLRSIFSSLYSEKTGLNEEEIKKKMDNETWFIGKDELAVWGDIIPTKSSKKIDKADAMIQFEGVKAYLKNNGDDIDNLVALLGKNPLENRAENRIEAKTSNKAEANTSQTLQTFINKDKKIMNEKIMNLEEFKAQNPVLYAEIYNLGINKEKDRVKAHLEFYDVAPNLVVENIKNGVEFLNNATLQAQYTRAGLNHKEIKELEDESPQSVIPKALSPEQTKKEIEAKNNQNSFNVDNIINLMEERR